MNWRQAIRDGLADGPRSAADLEIKVAAARMIRSPREASTAVLHLAEDACVTAELLAGALARLEEWMGGYPAVDRSSTGIAAPPRPCTTCDGTGARDGADCKACAGSGADLTDRGGDAQRDKRDEIYRLLGQATPVLQRLRQLVVNAATPPAVKQAEDRTAAKWCPAHLKAGKLVERNPNGSIACRWCCDTTRALGFPPPHELIVKHVEDPRSITRDLVDKLKAAHDAGQSAAQLAKITYGPKRITVPTAREGAHRRRANAAARLERIRA